MRKLLSWLIISLCLSACTADVVPRPQEAAFPQDFFDFRVKAEGREYKPVSVYDGGCIVFVPGGTDLTEVVASFESSGITTVTVNGVAQESGVSANNFKNNKKGVDFRLEFEDGKTQDYNVKVIDTELPVVTIDTDKPGKITSKTTWRGSSMRIMGENHKMTDIGPAEIRGRGNWTWDKYPKKPYALKLGNARKVLGMPAHKRWVLLAEYRGFIGNPLAFEASRRAPSIDWAPRGRFVELVLNGQFQGLYYLCEHIKIDPDRVNISKDGGYLLEYDELYDERHKFKSSGFGLPVQIKYPDEDLTDAQMDYIRNFINEMEAEIKKIGLPGGSRYTEYLDMDSFADYWMVLETVSNYEAYKPRSVKMSKGLDGVDSPEGTVCKLKAGPLWDQELFLVDKKFNSKDMYYYKYLFKDPAFVQTVKKRWEVYKGNILGNSQYKPFLDYMEDIVSTIKVSANRDIALWGNKYFTLSGEASAVRGGFVSKIEWMDTQIQAL